MLSKSTTLASVLISIYIIIQFLWYSQSILIPFIFAVLIWNLLSTSASLIQRLPVVGKSIPHILAILAAFGIISLIFFLIGVILTENMQAMMVSSARFQTNINLLLKKLPHLGFDTHYLFQLLQNEFKKIDLQQLFVQFYSSMSNLMSSLFLIILFVLFFFIEEVFFEQKFAKLFSENKSRAKVHGILVTILKEIQRYLGLKSLFSALTGFSLYVVLSFMRLEYAAFWGVLVFLFNFIPNIGPIIMTLIISLFAYFEWLDWSKVVLLLVIQISIHAYIGNYLETRYLGRTMHLSPLFILIALSFWGAIWGGMGLFLAVPMTVLMMIILSSFEASRFWAILMSENGELPDDIKTGTNA
jgi:AI-2 transport protein TqsA